jgi:4-cresol dehydrogenase (hydroxylating)
MSEGFEQFLESVATQLGSESIVQIAEASPQFRADTLPHPVGAEVVVCPKSELEVREVVRQANVFKVAIYPIATGNNWGYGGSLAVAPGAKVILDLSKLKSIIEINEEHGYVVLQPGVTQHQLSHELHSRNSSFHMDVSGAGPNTSVLGNILERGYGAGMYGDHFAALRGLEVVLPDGKLLRTGFWQYGEGAGAHIHKWGVGPYLEGIFTQSNFGVVTRACILLQRRAPCFEVGFLMFTNDDAFCLGMERLQKLLDLGVLSAAVNVASRSRVMSTQRQYPWDLAGGKTPLPVSVLRDGSGKVHEWSGCIAFSGTKRQVRMQKSEVRLALAGLSASLSCLSPHTVGLVGFFNRWWRRKNLQSASLAFTLLQGYPAELTLQSPYWRNRRATPTSDLHPARDHCGLIWFSPVVPMTRAALSEFVTLVRPVVHSYGFDDCFGFLSINQRAVLCSFPILFDRDDPLECDKALECYSKLFQLCKSKGFYVYRHGIHSMPHQSIACEAEEVTQGIIAAIKGALDSNGIIAPGRYARG